MTARVFIVIPAYNEQSAVFDVVSAVRAEYPDVVVVDDGSRDHTADEARRGGAAVLRHVINRGQGAALQTGLEYALRNGADVVVTFDADGQHRIEDVHRLVSALEQNDVDVAIGSRFLELKSNVPLFRRMMLWLATRFMRLTSGVALTDAHNGLRAFTRRGASKIQLTIDGMAHASEIVDQIYENRLRYAEVPVVVRYSEYSMRKGQSSLAAFRIAFDYLMKRIFR
ncbi:MAG TPA: glycosyltransferase family 2 protein [Thermoanaerobaculia bacterium]